MKNVLTTIKKTATISRGIPMDHSSKLGCLSASSELLSSVICDKAVFIFSILSASFSLPSLSSSLADSFFCSLSFSFPSCSLSSCSTCASASPLPLAPRGRSPAGPALLGDGAASLAAAPEACRRYGACWLFCAGCCSVVMFTLTSSPPIPLEFGMELEYPFVAMEGSYHPLVAIEGSYSPLKVVEVELSRLLCDPSRDPSHISGLQSRWTPCGARLPPSDCATGPRHARRAASRWSRSSSCWSRICLSEISRWSSRTPASQASRSSSNLALGRPAPGAASCAAADAADAPLPRVPGPAAL
mmetsp:Transcript_27167/g.80916  ORF Transcript_27167/g.80916 Transcript_27167/m.80916 type:complete len:301 (-) Transcript_27167:317-1219(-)